MTFWNKLNKPIVGLSPMDGVTDAAFRFMVDEIGEPSVMFTEFVPVEAVKAGASRVLDAFITHKTKNPIVAQLYGTNLDAYYISTLVVCMLGFDGVDINMGCPAKSVESRGAGAGLIKNPDLAKQIVEVVKKAVSDFERNDFERSIIPEKIAERVKTISIRNDRLLNNRISISVKTRIGFEENEVENWIAHLARQNLDAILLHGRTYRQMYRGQADWDAIKRASEIVKSISPNTYFLGNGDVRSVDDVEIYCQFKNIDGVLIGRGALGNPWIFQKEKGRVISKDEKFHVMLRHAEKFIEFYPDGHFLSLRKHLLWYASGFDGARDLHEKLQKVSSMGELVGLLRK
ncbi:MAG: tRNA-dihydrouridine synthase [Patescibacteria group bacterium]